MKIRILAVLMLIAIFFAGCGNNAGNNNNTPAPSAPASDKPTPTPVAETKSKYYFENSGVKIYMDDDAKPILEKLGEPPFGTFESPSCAFQGMDRTYYYNGFELYTYTESMEDETEYVFTVKLMSDAVSTPEGVSIGDKAEKVLEKYGDGYTEASGQYIYTDHNTRLAFKIQSGEVAAIEYSLVMEGNE
ncbi:MAG TPA: hypothetical protein GX501_09340 [Clostridiaceae bacterium]|nr:hypothetical protein [Clostridiaceae bacterium]